MKATHTLYRWYRYLGAHKFERGRSYTSRFKKDGTIMFYRGNELVCMGAYPPTLGYLKPEDLSKIRSGQSKDSFGKIHKYQFYYTLESRP